MAYAAVVSLSQILDQLVNTDGYGVEYPKPEIEYLYSKVCSLQSSLDKLSPPPISKRSEVEKLESQIRDIMYRAQDSIEFFISSQIRLSDSHGIGGDDNSASLLLQNLGEIRADLDPIAETAAEMSGNMNSAETRNFLVENALPSKSSSVGTSSRMVGLEEDRQQLKDALLDSEKTLQIISITGSPGIGKTALARSIYDDKLTMTQFNFRAWATISQDDNIQKILSNILSSMESRSYRPGHYSSQGSDNELKSRLHQELYNSRYLIVIDDVWDSSVLDQVRTCLPDNKNGSRIIITCRRAKVAVDASDHVMHPLDEENSWRLLYEHAFGGEDCPRHLETIGRNIAEKCGGIPLSILVVGGLLSQGPKTEEYWKSIEEDVHGAAAISDDSYLDILYLSYNNLQSRLKACFLYMAAFQEDSEIPVSKLINLWVAEGFLAQSPLSQPPQTLEQVAKRHLKYLIDTNMFSVRKMSSDGQPKTCSLQANLRQVAMQECQKESFFHAIRRYSQEEPTQGTKAQRRISVHNNILLCSEDVYNCTKSIEYARTLVYAGPNLHHPLPQCLTFELLRVLDALSVYFIELPNALFELVHLRYLAFTYDEDIPQSISKLQNLLILIIRQHPKIMFKRISNLPDEIWKLPHIRHLLFTECFLPAPFIAQKPFFFENLQSLSNVNVACCTKEILQNMPNLKKLCTWVEGSSVVIQFDLDQLQHLETFKFIVLKPIPGMMIEFHPKLVFPSTLRKLSLSGCGLPWEDMSVIEELPNLQVLKLRELAFNGEEWCPNSYNFKQLKFLLLESLNLRYWDADDSHFQRLERLIIRHCYNLEEINSNIGFIGSLQLIELVDCSPDAVASVEDIKDEQKRFENTHLQVQIYSSWE